MLIKLNNGRTMLQMVQGDTEEISIKLYDDGEETTFSAGDTATLAIRSITSTTNAISVSATAAAGASVITLQIKPYQSKLLGVTDYTYSWDLQIEFATGEVRTIVPKSPVMMIEQVAT